MNLRTLNNLKIRNVNGVFRRGEHVNTKYAEIAVECNKLLKARFNAKSRYGLSRGIEDLEKLYESDMRNNEGFILDTTIDYNSKNLLDENLLNSSDSIFSFKFGNYTKYNNVFKCKCGNLTSEQTGERCDVCGTYTDKIEYKRGWMIIDNFKIFNPDYLSLLLKHLDTKKNGISKKSIEDALFKDTRGLSSYNLITLQDKKVLSAFINDVVKEEYKHYFLDNIDKALTNKIPVISSNYRYFMVEPGLTKNNKSNIRTHNYNKFYLKMSNLINSLNNIDVKSSFTSKVISIIFLTSYYMKLHDIILDDLGQHKKKSLFRGKCSSNLKDASCKAIVEVDKSLDTDECRLGYTLFGIMSLRYFQKELKELKLSAEGFRRIHKFHPSTSDKIILNKLLQKLIKEKRNITTVLRAPSIYTVSIVALKITALDEDDICYVNELIIGPCLHGDKDGDTVICHMPHPDSMASMFMALHPSKTILNTVSGFINKSFELPESNYYLAHKVLKYAENRNKPEIISVDSLIKQGIYDGKRKLD